MREGRASRTAEQNALFRALEARGARVANDHLAAAFLPSSFRIVSELARVRVVRAAIERYIDARWPGPRGGQIVRTAYIDELVTRAAQSSEQVLILGAGLDSRAYRLDALRSSRVFEVDHPTSQAAKRRAVEKTLGEVPPHVVYVPVDFGRDDLGSSLTASGYVAGAGSVVLWEGVTNYLTAVSVDATFRTLEALVGRGSLVVFTYIDRDVVVGASASVGAMESSRAVANVGEPYTFGFEPSELRGYLHERGFNLVADHRVSELAPRYYTNGLAPVVYSYYHVAEARTR